MKIVVIKKNGTLCDLDWKKNVDLESIYKKAGFRNNNDFGIRNTWKIKDGEFISVYAKHAGRANTENKYDLPPPVDSDLYYGKLVIMRHSEQNPTVENSMDLTFNEWKTIYDKLMGGFEDLEDEEESEEEYVAPEDLTKQGYKKDGFVVEDIDEVINTEDSDEEEWISSSNEGATDDSLESIEDEEDEEDEDEEEDEEDKDEDEKDDEKEDEKEDKKDEECSDSSMPSLISDSDNELQEEGYEY